MLLHILARGRIKGPEAELVERYLKRIPGGRGGWTVKASELAVGKAPPPRGPGTIAILLDEKGEAWSSAELAKRLEGWRDAGRREARFLLGGADGFTAAERASADHLYAFGPATWPHLLARAMLAEQLYRATAMLANHPYHREG
ncbi:MAG: 23S rRNA (pseudouridine(1915)-N(3))-methyltransferase RlmH [Sphingosinicella sp.]